MRPALVCARQTYTALKRYRYKQLLSPEYRKIDSLYLIFFNLKCRLCQIYTKIKHYRKQKIRFGFFARFFAISKK